MKTITIHLRPDGCDETGDGSPQRPVATLKKGIDLTRSHGDVKRRILVGDGVYLDTHVQLAPGDSGLSIVADKDAQPAFYGGTCIENWRPAEDDARFWTADVAGTVDGSRDFRTLIVNGRLASRARYPEQGAIRQARSVTGRKRRARSWCGIYEKA